tara:strand:+ start:1423 stop:3693 length:2271 start_codon:yes stop_codon:yes gene_type:complete
MSKILIFLYLIVGLVPYFGAADKVDSQMMYLNILNCFNLLYLIHTYKLNFITKLKKTLSNLPVIFMWLFFLWSSITIIPAINKVEGLIALSEMFTILVALMFLTYHFKSQTSPSINQFIYYSIIILTLIELTSSLFPFFADISLRGGPNFQSIDYRGLTGNINILSYSLLMKLPFLIHFLFNRKGNKYFLIFLIIILNYTIISILETRSAILSLVLISFLLGFVYYFKDENKSIRLPLIYCVLPLVMSFSISSIQNTIFTDKSSVADRLVTLLEIEEDQSISQRFRFYSAAIQSFFENPILGIGVGNWEIESIKYDRKNTSTYNVPYHVHNDFLEILAESGFIAPILYFGILFYVMYLIFFKILNGNINKTENLLLIPIFFSLTAYLLDSMFNFPQARMISQINLMLLLSLSSVILKLDIKFKDLISNVIIVMLIILSIPSLYSSIRVYDSSKDQLILFTQFNNGDWSIPSLDIIEKMEHKYPNLSPTAMPLASHKAMHYLYNGDQRKAIELFKEGLPMNPYLYMTETFLGFAYKEVGDEENANYYTKLAFENAPNDAIHFANYLYTIAESSDSLLIKDIYFQVPEKFRTESHDEIYLLVTASLSDPASPDFTLDGIDIDFQAGNDRLKKGYYFNQVGVDKTLKANELYFLAMEYFELENYQEAIRYFLEAVELNPFELAYLENAANAYMRIQEDQKALELLDRLVLEFDSKSPKVFYLRALLLFEFDRKEEACIDFKIAYDAGLINSQLFSNFCN